ncbi:MAG: Gfo/Idh/MocA family oxidoreductase [Chloroflexota bacterium]|nr:Gfo/Idh/MocA family oxidoreductase [Chloroflexota bacterium]
MALADAIREMHRVLGSGQIGAPFRARIQMVSGFPVFENQPFLRDLEQFILADMGSHILDVARFLFGEARSLYCLTQQVRADVRGEDVATVMLEMTSGAAVSCELGYTGAPREHDRFPETYIIVEGDEGSAELGPDYWVRVTTREGTLSRRYPPPRYNWADPAYDVVHASIVECNRNLLGALRGEGDAETTGQDNLRTMQLVFSAYDSDARRDVIHLSP